MVPALFNLSIDKLLPENFFLIGYGRKSVENEEFRNTLKNSLNSYSRRSVDEKVWSKLELNVSFHSGAYDDEKSFDSLKSKIEEIESSVGEPVQSIFYLSTPPSGFLPILENLGNSGLARLAPQNPICFKSNYRKAFWPGSGECWELNQMINRRFAESQVFRIDHYLGKETVQSLLVQKICQHCF